MQQLLVRTGVEVMSLFNEQIDAQFPTETVATVWLRQVNYSQQHTSSWIDRFVQISLRNQRIQYIDTFLDIM